MNERSFFLFMFYFLLITSELSCVNDLAKSMLNLYRGEILKVMVYSFYSRRLMLTRLTGAEGIGI
jgi:hypothetical protein